MAFYSPSSSLGGYNNQKSPERAPPIDLTLLHNASTVLEEQFAKDSQAIPELGEILRESIFPTELRPSTAPQPMDRRRRPTVYFLTTFEYRFKSANWLGFRKLYFNTTAVCIQSSTFS